MHGLSGCFCSLGSYCCQLVFLTVYSASVTFGTLHAAAFSVLFFYCETLLSFAANIYSAHSTYRCFCFLTCFSAHPIFFSNALALLSAILVAYSFCVGCLCWLHKVSVGNMGEPLKLYLSGATAWAWLQYDWPLSYCNLSGQRRANRQKVVIVQPLVSTVYSHHDTARDTEAIGQWSKALISKALLVALAPLRILLDNMFALDSCQAVWLQCMKCMNSPSMTIGRAQQDTSKNTVRSIH